MSRLEVLAVGKACYAWLYSYSRLRKRKPLIAQGTNQEGGGGGSLNFCARSTPPWDTHNVRDLNRLR